MFQFPLHRDPRCNGILETKTHVTEVRFSSLYIGILAATRCKDSFRYARGHSFSSLYIGILAATNGNCVTCLFVQRFSSLYIGILAATWDRRISLGAAS